MKNRSIPFALYHLGLDTVKIEGARYAFLPGDPGRVPEIAKAFDPNAKEIGYKREYRTWLGKINAKSVLVTSTGIGGPSTSIVVDELAQLGVKTFLRVGTTGAIQPAILAGDVIITTGAVRIDGASTHYAPIEYPAVADYEIVKVLVEAAQAQAISYHVGISASCDTFYPGQERVESFFQYIPRRFKGQTEELRRLHVLNYEMEAATVLTLCSAFGLRGGCIAGVVTNRMKENGVAPEDLVLGERNAIKTAVEAMRILVQV